MSPSERQNAIVEHLDTVGACLYQDLARLLAVSEMTIRRDVDKLVQGGRVIKTLGGAQTAHAAKNLYESPVEQRLSVHRAEKEQIARAARARSGRNKLFFSMAARPASFWPGNWPRRCGD